jgi:hypothetical protein
MHVALEVEQPARSQLRRQQIDKGRREEPLHLVLFFHQGSGKRTCTTSARPVGDDARQVEAGVVVAEPEVGRGATPDPLHPHASVRSAASP